MVSFYGHRPAKCIQCLLQVVVYLLYALVLAGNVIRSIVGLVREHQGLWHMADRHRNEPCGSGIGDDRAVETEAQ